MAAGHAFFVYGIQEKSTMQSEKRPLSDAQYISTFGITKHQ